MQATPGAIEGAIGDARHPARRLETVGIVGGGVMGRGLAEALLETGHQVVVVDRDREAREGVRAAVRRSLMSRALTEPGPRPSLNCLERLRTTEDMTALRAADFVIENVTERWTIKAELYPLLDAICTPSTVIAANTSTFPVSRLAELTTRADRIVGMHFMNPVPAKPMVEVICGAGTSDETLAIVDRLLGQLGKERILVGDGPGFVSNRVLMLTINEAIAVVEEGVADARTVDQLFCGCFGHAMGPLATADLIGLDTILLSLESLRTLRDDPKFAPSALLEDLVAAGRLGRKTGRGFFNYIEGTGR